MKKITLLAILVLGIVSFGCEKCDCDSDEYYIKYAAGAETIYSGGTLSINMRDENNENSSLDVTRNSWDIVIGPVGKGFTASLSVSSTYRYHTTLKAFIYISKNDSPFALKASDASDSEEGDPVDISFTIDY